MATVKSFNEATSEEKKRLLRGEFGNELLRILRKSVAPLYWGRRDEGLTVNNGSMFFVQTRSHLLAITARHVYDSYIEQSASDPTIRCYISGLSFEPRNRLMGLGQDCDLATFARTPVELVELEKLTVPWPPAIPNCGHSVLYGGFPGSERRSPQPYHTDFGLYLAMGAVDSVNDRDFSVVKPGDDHLVDIIGKGLPPLQYDMGGMSGGPVALLQETAGIISWSIAGIIYQNHQTFEIMKAVRADFISEDGEIKS